MIKLKKNWPSKPKKFIKQKLDANGFGEIVTEILPVSEEFYAEDYHQQYLAKILTVTVDMAVVVVRFKD